MAHIVAAVSSGPRGDGELSADDRAKYPNLILLCASCHTLVDKAPSEFPVELLKSWKESHEASIRSLLGARKVATREAAREYVQALLRQGFQVFKAYGPSEEDPDWSGDKAPSWRRKVLEVIIPNGRKILTFVDLNRRLLRPEEEGVVEQFRLHIDDLEMRHAHHLVEVVAQRFPIGMNSLFEEC
jgi:hypothetical protein